MRRSLLVALVLVASCKTRLFPPRDEVGTPPDASVDATACYAHHARVEVPLTELALVDDATWLTTTRAVRLRVGYPLRAACDVPGDVSPEILGPNRVALHAFVWRSDRSDGDCGAVTTEERIVVVENIIMLAANTVSVEDGAPGGTLSQLVPLMPGPGGTCSPSRDGTCDEDCDCTALDPAARCVPTGPATGQCARVCSEDADCFRPLSIFGNQCDRTAWTCVHDLTCPTSCPFGQQCTNGDNHGGCQPDQTTMVDAPCKCDDDCGQGGVCDLTVDQGYCRIPCTTIYDCPDRYPACTNGACFSGE